MDSSLNFWSILFNSKTVYLNRISHDLVLRTTVTKYYPGLTWNRVERQGPADGVTPVLTPMNPLSPNSLLVFSQVMVLVCPKVLLYILQLNEIFPTIYLNVECYIVNLVSTATSRAQEYAFSFISPCVLAKCVFFKPKCFASLFIWWMNSLNVDFRFIVILVMKFWGFSEDSGHLYLLIKAEYRLIILPPH